MAKRRENNSWAYGSSNAWNVDEYYDQDIPRATAVKKKDKKRTTRRLKLTTLASKLAQDYMVGSARPADHGIADLTNQAASYLRGLEEVTEYADIHRLCEEGPGGITLLPIQLEEKIIYIPRREKKDSDKKY